MTHLHICLIQAAKTLNHSLGLWNLQAVERSDRQVSVPCEIRELGPPNPYVHQSPREGQHAGVRDVTWMTRMAVHPPVIANIASMFPGRRPSGWMSSNGLAMSRDGPEPHAAAAFPRPMHGDSPWGVTRFRRATQPTCAARGQRACATRADVTDHGRPRNCDHQPTIVVPGRLTSRA
jgi:hypothetical protein